MSKSNTFENEWLLLIFNGTTITGLADNAASGTITDLYVSLHTADPGEGGTQATSETTYTGYARIPVVRTSSGWTVTGSSVSPAADILFGACTSGTPTITHASVGTAISGSNRYLYSGALTPNISVSPGIEPIIKTTSTITEE